MKLLKIKGKCIHSFSKWLSTKYLSGHSVLSTEKQNKISTLGNLPSDEGTIKMKILQVIVMILAFNCSEMESHGRF